MSYRAVRNRQCNSRESRCRHPRSLFGRLMLIWLLGLALVLVMRYRPQGLWPAERR